jgi:hypothetical protein
MARPPHPFAASAALLLATLSGGTARADVIHARYTVTFAGLRIGDAVATGTLDPATYKIDLSARLTGLAAMLANVRMALVSTGAIHRNSLLPSTYATTSSNSRETRTVRMALNSGTVRAVDIAPPFEDIQGRIPVTEANKRNVLDPTSALIMPVAAGEPLVGPSACNRTLPIFDGFARYDINMSFAGTRDVAVRGYTGPVSVCRARYVPISGHRADSKSTRFMADQSDIEAWLVPVERAHIVVPFHVSLTTQNGTAVIDAVDFGIEPAGAPVR